MQRRGAAGAGTCTASLANHGHPEASPCQAVKARAGANHLGMGKHACRGAKNQEGSKQVREPRKAGSLPWKFVRQFVYLSQLMAAPIDSPMTAESEPIPPPPKDSRADDRRLWVGNLDTRLREWASRGGMPL
ncbi:hypothetical protein O3P69_019670 [Scylla paramamosain]|uniref:Uncharacterized protein n=1 Tax=Scylla paramamosain TaxID=85552 RepID=A0AAW0SXH9_SCYPA